MSDRPNIVIVMPDQHRADSVGAFGNPVVKTPNIDALAARGVRFANAFGQHTVCSPSRVSIFTSWYPHVAGHRTLEHLIKPWEPSLLRYFKESGYNVAWAGLRGDTYAPGGTKECTDFAGFLEAPQYAWRDNEYDLENKMTKAFYLGKRPVEGVALDTDEAVTRTAEQWLASKPREPWLLYVALSFPHVPFEVEEPWFSLHDRSEMAPPLPANFEGKPKYVKAIHERYGLPQLTADDWAEIKAVYYGMISRVDDQLGRVTDAVTKLGALDRTAFAFYTDHGEYLGDYGLVEKWPAGLEDCLTHIPLVMSVPGMTEGGTAEALVEMIDFMPTLLELAGIEATHDHFGRSLVPLLRDPSAPHREAVFSEGGHRVEDIHHLEKSGTPLYSPKGQQQQDDPSSVGKAVACRTERWTYVHRIYDTNELYDRVADPGETKNLVNEPEHAAVVDEMQGRVLNWMIETADVVPRKKDPRWDPELRNS